MRSLAAASMLLMFTLLWPGLNQAGDFVQYPGSVLDRDMSTKSTMAIKKSGSSDEVHVYTSRDGFDKVVAFYKKAGKEYAAPWTKLVRKLPDGRDIKVKVILLDGADDVSESKHWVQVQYPFIGDVEMAGSTPRYKDVRDATSIVYTHLKN